MLLCMILVFNIPDPLLAEDTAGTGVENVFFEALPDVVTPSQTPQKSWEAPGDVEIITQEDIVRSGARDIYDLLMYVAGIDVKRGGVSQQVAPNGFVNTLMVSTTLVMLDGIPITSPLGEYFFPGDVPLHIIKRIEIVKGPGSALYGADAVAGIINIITKSDEDTSCRLETNYWAGDRRTRRGSWLLSDTRMHSGLVLSFGPYRTDARDDHAVNENDEMVRHDYFLKYRNGKHMFRYMGRRWGQGRPGSITEDNETDQWRAREEFLLWRCKFHETQDSLFKIDCYYNGQDGDFPPPEGVGFVPYTNQRKGVRLMWRRLLPRTGNVLVSGINYEHRASTFDGIDGTKSSAKRAFYIQDIFDLSSFTTVTAGFRIDDDNIYGHTWNPRVAFSFKSTPVFSYKFSWGRSFRAPSFGELYLDYPVDSTTIYIPGYGTTTAVVMAEPNPDLQPEIGDTWTIGASGILADRYYFSLSAWHTDVTNYIEAQQTRTSINPLGTSYVYYQASNTGKVEFRGLTFSLKSMPWAEVQWYVNYTYTDSRNDITDERLAYVPYHKGNMGIEFKLDRSGRKAPRTTLTFNLHVTGKRKTENGEIGGYNTLHLTLNHRLQKDMRISFTVQNLFDNSYMWKEGYPAEGRRWQIRLSQFF